MNNFENISGYTSRPLVACGVIENINADVSSDDFDYLVKELGFIRIYNEFTGEFKRLELRNNGQKIMIIEPYHSTEYNADISVGVRDNKEFNKVLQTITKLSRMYGINWYNSI